VEAIRKMAFIVYLQTGVCHVISLVVRLLSDRPSLSRALYSLQRTEAVAHWVEVKFVKPESLEISDALL